MKMSIDLSTLIDPDIDEVDYLDELEAIKSKYDFVLAGVKAQRESRRKPRQLPEPVATWLNHANDEFQLLNKMINYMKAEQNWLIVTDGRCLFACKNKPTYKISEGIYYLLGSYAVPCLETTKQYPDVWAVVNPLQKGDAVVIDDAVKGRHVCMDMIGWTKPYKAYFQQRYVDAALTWPHEHTIHLHGKDKLMKITWKDAFAVIMPCKMP